MIAGIIKIKMIIKFKILIFNKNLKKFLIRLIKNLILGWKKQFSLKFEIYLILIKIKFKNYF